MKKLLHEVKESSGSAYQLYAELTPCQHPADAKQLVFSSVWTGSSNPKEHQKKCEFMLSPDAVINLKQLLEGE